MSILRRFSSHRLRKRILVFTALTISLSSAAQELPPVSGIVVGIPDASAFPVVTVDARVFSGGLLVGGLETSLQVVENGVTIEEALVERLDDQPIHLTIFIDDNPYGFSALSSAEIGTLLQGLLTAGLREGDTVSVYSASGLVDEYRTLESLRRWIAGGAQVPQAPDTVSISGLTTLINTIGSQKAAGEIVGLIYVTRIPQEGLGSGNKTSIIDGLANEARKFNLPINVIHADSANSGFSAELPNLASQTGGAYIGLNNGSAGAQTLTWAAATLGPLFSNRTHYRIRYRSMNGISSPREVQIQANGQSSSASYSIALQNPSVTILTPTNGQDILRGVTPNAEVGRNEFSVDSFNVAFRVDFPDGISRLLREVQLIESSPFGEQTVFLLNPTSDVREFQVTWDLSSIEAAGDNPRTLRAVVVDELSLTGMSQIQVKVPISVPPPVPTALPAPVIVQTPCDQNSSSTGCVQQRITTYAPYFVIGVMTLVIVVLRRRIAKLVPKPIGDAVQSVTTLLGTSIGTMRKTVLGVFSAVGSQHKQEDALAYIDVIHGPSGSKGGSDVGRNISIFQKITKIGRDPTQCNIVFYGPQDSSTLSRLHCSIAIDPIQRTATLMNISPGITSVDGEQFAQNQTTTLADGAQVQLGDLTNSGLLFTFRYGPQLAGNIGSGGRVTDIGLQSLEKQTESGTSLSGSSASGENSDAGDAAKQKQRDMQKTAEWKKTLG